MSVRAGTAILAFAIGVGVVVSLSIAYVHSPAQAQPPGLCRHEGLRDVSH